MTGTRESYRLGRAGAKDDNILQSTPFTNTMENNDAMAPMTLPSPSLFKKNLPTTSRCMPKEKKIHDMLVLLKMFLHLYADKGEDHEIPEKNNLYVMYDVCACMCAGQSWASRVYLCHALHY